MSKEIYDNLHFLHFLQVPDWELLHAIVGLYDSYLPEITPEVLYSTLTCRSSLTLVFLKEPQGMQPRFSLYFHGLLGRLFRCIFVFCYTCAQAFTVILKGLLEDSRFFLKGLKQVKLKDRWKSLAPA